MYTESHCSSISDRFDAIHKETVLFPSALISMTVNKVFSLRYFRSKKKKQNLNLQKKKEKKRNTRAKNKLLFVSPRRGIICCFLLKDEI